MKKQSDRCLICGESMRRVHITPNGSWCWKCEPYRPGSSIQTSKTNNVEKAINHASIEFLKALVFIALGYAWAVTAYGISIG